VRRLFRSGFGRLTAPMLTDATAAGELVAKQGDALAKAAAEWTSNPQAPPYLLARLTGQTAIASTTNRWEYDWEEVSISSALALVARTYTSANAGKAYNLCEFLNNGSGYEGPGWDLATAPSGFDIRPIRDAVVMLWPLDLDGGEARWIFQLANVLDGSCPSP
jgi:hypothetical protein